MPSNRARNGRRANESKGGNSQRQAGGSRDGTPGASQTRRGGKSAATVNRSTDNSQNGPAIQNSSTAQEEHASAGFNSEAVEAALKQGFEAKATLYKPEAKPQNARSESPWGVKRESLKIALS